MIEFGKTEVYGFEHAIRGMRNSFNSWDKSDSGLVLNKQWTDTINPNYKYMDLVNSSIKYDVGDADLALMHKLYQAGPDHAKFLRQIQLWVDVKAPLYWWKQMDQYSVGVTSNSTSTMHMIQSKEFTLDDFSHDQLYIAEGMSWEGFEVDDIVDYNGEYPNTPTDVLLFTIEALNVYRKRFLKTRNKGYWWNMIQLLPSSYNQLRTLNLNYAVLANAYKSRKGHRLDEWQTFREWCESLPYFKAIVCGE